MFYSISRVSVSYVCDQSITVKLYLTIKPIEKLSDQSITLKWKVMECFEFDQQDLKLIFHPYNVNLIKQKKDVILTYVTKNKNSI
jgi:hypothetical protein